jgi:hypothetical protein
VVALDAVDSLPQKPSLDDDALDYEEELKISKYLPPRICLLYIAEEPVYNFNVLPVRSFENIFVDILSLSK